jgi:hypothetical protein
VTPSTCRVDAEPPDVRVASFAPSVSVRPLRLAALGTSPELLRVQGRSWSNAQSAVRRLCSRERVSPGFDREQDETPPLNRHAIQGRWIASEASETEGSHELGRQGTREPTSLARTALPASARPLRLAALGTSPELLRVQGRSWSNAQSAVRRLCSRERRSPGFDREHDETPPLNRHAIQGRWIASAASETEGSSGLGRHTSRERASLRSRLRRQPLPPQHDPSASLRSAPPLNCSAFRGGVGPTRNRRPGDFVRANDALPASIASTTKLLP